MISRFLMACGAVLLSAAATAQPPQPRILEVPDAAYWQHALTGMILPPHAGGLVRGALKDNGSEERDVSAVYQSPEGGTTVTFYLYQTAVPDVGLWFDRAGAAIVKTPHWGIDAALVPSPKPFARPGGTVESGLLFAMPAKASDAVSTGLAIAPLGDWLVKVRMSSETLDPAALEARMRAFLSDLRWPAPGADERAARPIEPCAKPLKFKRAKLLRSDPADVLLTLVAGITVEESNRPPPVYCRDPVDLGMDGLYRPDGSKKAYLIALGDAGIGIRVAPALSIAGLGGGGGGWAMTLLDRNSHSALRSFNRLPPPDQALAVAFGGGPTMSVTSKAGAND